ncbi:Gmad2 immunoglobulin-like domain-containing protein [Nitrosomonas aestuarii]|uniref:Gmad2 immunoglobulin-like domain-containing protein n=1 Tax=Nitrosomonas aestuarii TaxID=52441 RepID=UPI001FCDB5BD|nr:Gmad2 immunoglobulin-like domain-containing protein [Nitrosomonas aestuarii]
MGEKIVINGWVDYNAQPTADVLLNFQVITENNTVIVEKSSSSDKQGHFQFELDTKNLPPGIYKIMVTSHCLEVHRSICSYNSETLVVELNSP